MRKILLLLSLVFPSVASFAVDRPLLEVLHDHARAFNLSFTIEYLPTAPVVSGGWRSKLVDSSGTIDAAGDPMAARAALEQGLRDWLVVPSHTKPRVWHLIDRQLLVRSPMDGTLSNFTFNGTASLLVDALAKDPTLRVVGPTVAATGELGRGAPIQLADFSGRIRDALTVSFAIDDGSRQVVQWVAECEAMPSHDIVSILYIQRSPKPKAKPERP